MGDSKWIIFFDGFCVFCNGSVDWIIVRDRGQNFVFAPIQGETAQKELPAEIRKELSTIAVKTKDGFLYKSRAIFFIISKFNSWIRFFALLRFLPLVLTDFFYDLIAKNRYLIFGKRDACRRPSESEKSLILP